MSLASDIAAFKATVDAEITTAGSPLSIAPDMVGSAFDNLADILELYNGQAFDVLSDVGVPSPLIGANGDLYFRNNNPIEVYKKYSALWVLKATLDLGIIFPDGPLIGLLTSIDGFVVTVTPGGWTIDNVIYRKATQTQFTLSVADANYGRYDLIYGTDANTILIEEGTASISPAIPATPVDGTMIDIAFIPSVASGQLPYLLYGNNTGTSSVPITISDTFDASGEYDASGDSVPSFPNYTVYNSTGYSIAVDYDNTNKKLVGGTALEAFTAKFR